MYNQNTTLDLESFLKAIGFVPPEGFQVDYFIVPRGESFMVPKGAPVAEQGYEDDSSITYQMTQPILKHDMAPTPPEYQIWEVPEIGRRQPTITQLPRVTEPEDLESPFVKIQESVREDRLEFSLRKSLFPFPKGTFFSCKKTRRRV